MTSDYYPLVNRSLSLNIPRQNTLHPSQKKGKNKCKIHEQLNKE